MHEFLIDYKQISPATWAYLSSLLAFALYFKFNRVLSMRNVDLVLLILLAPGLILIEKGMQKAQDSLTLQGYMWLFCVSLIFLIRMLSDTSMVRRPLLEANLNRGGMVFLGISLMIFLSAKIISTNPDNKVLAPTSQASVKSQTALNQPIDAPPSAATLQAAPAKLTLSYEESTHQDIASTRYASQLLASNTTDSAIALIEENQVKSAAENSDATDGTSESALKSKTQPKKVEHIPSTSQIEPKYEGPGFQLIYSLVPNWVTPVFPSENRRNDPETIKQFGTTCTIAILSHFAIVIGIVLIGYLHFGNINSGIAAALMFLLLPYTVIYIGWVRHSLPAAMMVWAVVLYRRPLLAGILIGLASGTVYYPIFMLPLWASFYWQRGVWRFASGVLTSIAVLSIVQAFYVGSNAEYLEKITQMFGLSSPTTNPEGFWKLLDNNIRVYRIPVLAAHIALCWSFAFWPVQKNLGTLLSGSAALMISTQFWAAYGGGISIAWYLPFLLLSIFRPNLEDRVALTVLGDGWLKVHRNGTNSVSRAA